jgi:hypothetical protein
LANESIDIELPLSVLAPPIRHTVLKAFWRWKLLNARTAIGNSTIELNRNIAEGRERLLLLALRSIAPSAFFPDIVNLLGSGMRREPPPHPTMTSELM